ncbi:hypothetical protein [Bacillus massiliigorillae]|uniref:hypothetical protein n=1 Tax=Bacillus massiliigorillae TaxID=1243664 RepID=UPI0003A546D6|nr:hypothetical protein [Bacillus massiliigorillae]
MSKITQISDETYIFNAEPNIHDAWTATLLMKKHDDHLNIYVQICMSYLHHIEDYERLLNEIRHFCKQSKEVMKKEKCTVNFHCQGIACFQDIFSLPAFENPDHREYIDTSFSEEIQ